MDLSHVKKVRENDILTILKNAESGDFFLRQRCARRSVRIFFSSPAPRAVGRSIHASSWRQDCTAGSTAETEIIAESAASNEIVHFRGLCFDLRLKQLQPTECEIDNSSCVNIAEDYASSNRTRRIARRHMCVLDFTHRGVICASNSFPAPTTSQTSSPRYSRSSRSRGIDV